MVFLLFGCRTHGACWKKNKLVTENVNWSVFPYNLLLSWFSIALPWTHGFKLVHNISISSCLFLITINKLPLEYFKTITQYNECSRERAHFWSDRVQLLLWFFVFLWLLFQLNSLVLSMNNVQIKNWMWFFKLGILALDILLKFRF